MSPCNMFATHITSHDRYKSYNFKIKLNCIIIIYKKFTSLINQSWLLKDSPFKHINWSISKPVKSVTVSY